MKNKQYTNTILMVEPVAFYYNPQTAINNYFQEETKEKKEEIQAQALAEFKGMVSKLREHGVNVILLKDTLSPHTPDSIFPNNWITFHEDGAVALYPMFAKNRREERREEDVFELLESREFFIDDIIDYSKAEEEEIFLEGTGSIVLDRENRIAYAAISPRTEEELFIEFCEDFEYTPAVFEAFQTVDNQRKQIYHTNVMMCIADKYVVIALSTLDKPEDKKLLLKHFKRTNKEIIDITEEQMAHFAGNMLQVGGLGRAYLVMSQTAYKSLRKEQIDAIEKYNPIITVEIDLIERLGGGSARCMMAEVFLPKI